MQPVALPVPYQGVYDRLPSIAVQNPYCANIHNFNNSLSGISVRNGDAKVLGASAPVAGVGSVSLAKIINYNDTVLFAVYYSNFAALISITVILGSGGTTTLALISPSMPLFTSVQYNGYLFVFNSISNASNLTYDGAAWAALGYTSASGYLPFGGCVYKNRVYLLGFGTSAYMFSEISAITGALNEVSLATIASKKSYLVAITPITVAEDVSAQTYLAFVFASGEVLFYNGSFPNSSDWSLVGRASISQPLDFHSYTEYQGDVLLLTDAGIISLRDLFLSGSKNATSLSVSGNISKTWKEAITAVRTYAPVGPLSLSTSIVSGAVSIVWVPKTNKIIVILPLHVENGDLSLSGVYFIVLDTDLNAFVTHESNLSDGGTITYFNANGMTTYQGDLYYVVNNNDNTTQWFGIYLKEGQTDSTKLFLDDILVNANQNSISFDLVSAPITQNNGYVNKIQGMDVILESDLSTTTSYTLIKDLGVGQTSAQKVTFGSGIQKPFVNLGIEGTYIQYQVSGTTAANKTVGLDLYGVNIWQDQGASPR